MINRFNYDEIKCIKTSDYEAIQKVKEHCIKGDPDSKICELCIRDYVLNEKNNCIDFDCHWFFEYESLRRASPQF